MLDCHPEVVVPPECGFMDWWYPKYKDWSLKSSLDKDVITKFCLDLTSSRKFETWNFNLNLFKEKVLLIQPKNYSELCALVYITFGEDKGKAMKIWGDKNNYYIHKLNVMENLYPKAKYIHLVRDGRDVAVSYLELKELKSESKYKPNLPLEINEIANEWVQNTMKVDSFLENIDPKRKQIILYEDLIQHTEKILKQICGFLEIEFSNSMLNYYLQNKAENIEPVELMDWKMKTLEKPDFDNIGKFKKLLSSLQLETFERKANSTLMHYGYK